MKRLIAAIFISLLITTYAALTDSGLALILNVPGFFIDRYIPFYLYFQIGSHVISIALADVLFYCALAYGLIGLLQKMKSTVGATASLFNLN